MAECIVAEGLCRVFGSEQSKALSMLKRGESATRIRERTGSTAAVINVSFSVDPGEIFVIMGLSGSGKSTLVRMINGLISPSAGKLHVNDASVPDMSFRELVELRRKSISMVFQSFALLPHLNVLDNVAFGLKIAGMPASRRHGIAQQTLAQVGLEGYGESFPHELSGGMQQRVGLARALAVDPDILLMDEAFSALDPLIRKEMQYDLLTLQKERARTIVFISHDLEEAIRLGDRIAILQDGELAQVGTPQEILMHPANDYVQAFFRNVDVTQVYTAAHVAEWPSAVMAERKRFGIEDAIKALDFHDTNYGVVTDRAGKFEGIVTRHSLESVSANKSPCLTSAFVESDHVRGEDTLCDLLALVGHSPVPVPVLADNGRFLGVLSQGELLLKLDRSDNERALS